MSSRTRHSIEKGGGRRSWQDLPLGRQLEEEDKRTMGICCMWGNVRSRIECRVPQGRSPSSTRHSLVYILYFPYTANYPLYICFVPYTLSEKLSKIHKLSVTHTTRDCPEFLNGVGGGGKHMTHLGVDNSALHCRACH